MCEALNQRGERCQAPPLKGSRFCYHHAPELAAERAAARRRGGLRSHGLNPEAPAPEVRFRAVSDVLRLLEVAGEDILRQKPSLARARALAYLGGVCLKAFELSEIEARVRALENRSPGYASMMGPIAERGADA
jgi:hypothetical protein